MASSNPIKLDFTPEGFIPLEEETFPVNQKPIKLDFTPEDFVPASKFSSEDYGEDFSDKSLSAGLRPFVNEATAGAAGALPDLAVLAVNAEECRRSKVTGSDPHYVGSVTDKIADYLNQGLTEEQKLGNISKGATRFLSSLFSLGYLGKGAEFVGKSAQNIDTLSKVGKGLEKTGSFVSKHLGMTEPSLRNIGAATAAGATSGIAKNMDLPAYAEIPAVLLAFMFGGGAGKQADKLLKPLLEKVPGLETFIQKQGYQELAQNIHPEAVGDLLKRSLLEQETEFLTQKTLSEFPKELQQKLKDTPELLNDAEINLVLKKGLNDYQNYVKGLEQEYEIPLTAGEFTGSPRMLAKEDALANKPNIETFDTFTKNRRASIVRGLEKIKYDLSSEKTDKTKLGETISSEVERVYKNARDLRTRNWEKNFEGVVNDPIIPIPTYVAKLKEFAQLHPDTEGHKVAIRLAKSKLNKIDQDSVGSIRLLSPRRVNNILAGHNEDLMRFPDKTFSRKQVGELKIALEADLDMATQVHPPSPIEMQMGAIRNELAPEMAQRVQKARAAYKEDSQLIDQIDDSILFSKIDKESLTVPEKVTQALENMEPSQAKLTLEALKRSENTGEVIPQIQRHTLEQALKAATKNGVENFNPRLFLQHLPEKSTFDVLFDGTKAYQEIKDISFLLKRMWKYEPQRKGSQTAQRLQADAMDMEDSVFKAGVDVAKGRFVKGTLSLGEAFAGKNASQAEKKIAEILIDPEKRQEILKQVGKEKDVLSTKKALVQDEVRREDKNTKKDALPRIPRLSDAFSRLKDLKK